MGPFTCTVLTEKYSVETVSVYLKKLDINTADINKMFLNHPRIAFCYKPKNLEIKLRYLLEKMYLPFSMIASNPVILTYSIKRIGSRLDYVRCIAPTLIQCFSLTYWIQPTDKVFITDRLRCGSLQDYEKFKEKWSNHI